MSGNSFLYGPPYDTLRLLFVFEELGVQGVRAHRLNLIAQLREQVDELAVVAGRFGHTRNNRILDRLRALGVESARAPWLEEVEGHGRSGVLSAFLGSENPSPRGFDQLLARYEPNAVHVGASSAAYPLAELGRKRGVATVLSLHADQVRLSDQAIMHNVTPQLLQKCRFSVICPTPRWKHRLETGWGLSGNAAMSRSLPPKRVHVVPSALDDSTYRPPASHQVEAWREEFGLEEGSLAVFAAGPVADAARFEVLIRAVASLRGDGVETALLVVPSVLGGDEAVEEFLRLAKQYDADQNLVVATADPQRSAFWASDVAVLPTSANLPGTTLSRAMLCGVPAIRTKCGGGAEDQVHHLNSGFVVPQNDPGALARRLQELAKSERLRRQMGHRAAAQACFAHEPERAASLAVEAYRSAVKPYRTAYQELEAEPGGV